MEVRRVLFRSWHPRAFCSILCISATVKLTQCFSPPASCLTRYRPSPMFAADPSDKEIFSSVAIITSRSRFDDATNRDVCLFAVCSFYQSPGHVGQPCFQRSEEQTSELQSLMRISSAFFFL